MHERFVLLELSHKERRDSADLVDTRNMVDEPRFQTDFFNFAIDNTSVLGIKNIMSGFFMKALAAPTKYIF